MCDVNEKYINCLLDCLGYPSSGLDFQGGGKSMRFGVSLRGHGSGRRGERLLGHLLTIAKAQASLRAGEALTSTALCPLIPLHKNSIYGVLEVLLKMRWVRRQKINGSGRNYNYFITKEGLKKLQDTYGKELDGITFTDEL